MDHEDPQVEVETPQPPGPDRADNENRTGLPDHLKAGVEGLSGVSLDNVKVHYNSSHPAQLNALAYAQGNDIHIAPGKERYLPHEAWHVAQQAQGRVRPTMQMMNGAPVSDDMALEQEADVMGALAEHTPAAPHGDLQPSTSRKAAIQRKVGFELEIGSISTTKTDLFGRRNKLDKKNVVVAGVGYNVEADEETLHDPNYPVTRYSGYSDLEFVTDAFPVTLAGFGLLTTALTEISAIMSYIAGHQNTDIAAAALPHGAPTAGRFVRFGGGLMTGKPQATVGLSLSALNDLFQQISMNPGGGGAAATHAQELFGGGLDPYGGSAGGTAAATGLADVTAAHAAATAEITASLPLAQRTPEMIALVTNLILYLDTGERGASGYGKTIGGSFMMRTAFDRVYREVPPAGRILTDANPDVFALMVCRAARRVNPNIDDIGDVFSGGIYNDPFKYGPASAHAKTNAERQDMTGHLRRRDWLQGIASGTDLLTQAHFPSRRSRRLNEIESLGRYGPNTDPMGPHHLPVLEFRGLPPLPAGLFPLMAMDIFRYVFAMNTAAGGGNPGGLQALGLAQRNTLADPADPNFAGEVANAVGAAALAVAAWGGAASGGD